MTITYPPISAFSLLDFAAIQMDFKYSVWRLLTDDELFDLERRVADLGPIGRWTALRDACAPQARFLRAIHAPRS